MLDEPVLLHEPDLMLALLRAGCAGPAGIETARERLASTCRLAGEPRPEGADLDRRLEEAADRLAAAGALERRGKRYVTTARGRQLLEDNPDGVDQSVLLSFAEFRAHVASLGEERIEDPRSSAYDAGLRAFLDGRRADENPYASDSIDHLAWENGWSEARDTRR